MRDGRRIDTRQQMLLWALVSRGGSALRKDLKPEVEAADRTALERRGFVSTRREKGNAMRLTIENRGWDHLATAAPTLLASGRGSAFDRPILQFVLERIQAYATANDVPFARVFVPAASGGGAEPGEDPPREMPRANGSRGKAWRNAFEAAFFAIAGRPPLNHVRLRALRARLDGTPRAEIDRALAAMRAGGRISLSTLSNPADVAREGDAPISDRRPHLPHHLD